MKGQSAMEFVVLASFMLLVILGFFAITTSRMFEAREEIDQKTAEDIAKFAFKEIEVAASVSDGYTRVFSIPRTINGVNYSIEIIDDRELVINYLGHEYVVFLPMSVSGNLSKGTNMIKKENEVIYLSSVASECENGIDDDSDGLADSDDPGCYASCNYLASSSYSPDWAESDVCQCTHLGIQCCVGTTFNLHYELFDDTCGMGQCWSGCRGTRVLSLKGAQNSVFFLSDGNLIIRGTVTENTPAVQSGDTEIVVRNSAGNNVMVASDLTGNILITGGLYQDQQLSGSSEYHRLIIRDIDGTNVAFVDELGNLYLKGNLTENAGSILDQQN